MYKAVCIAGVCLTGCIYRGDVYQTLSMPQAVSGGIWYI
jgi:hypothetical protein